MKNQYINIIIILIVLVLFSIFYVFALKRSYNKTEIEKKFIYEKGYNDACKDFYNGKIKINLIENSVNDSFEKNHKKRRDGIPVDCKNLQSISFVAWDDKNYFESSNFQRWNSEDYYFKKMLTCPKCGSIRIIGNVPRDRGVIFAYRCLDCHYVWEKE